MVRGGLGGPPDHLVTDHPGHDQVTARNAQLLPDGQRGRREGIGVVAAERGDVVELQRVPGGAVHEGRKGGGRLVPGAHDGTLRVGGPESAQVAQESLTGRRRHPGQLHAQRVDEPLLDPAERHLGDVVVAGPGDPLGERLCHRASSDPPLHVLRPGLRVLLRHARTRRPRTAKVALGAQHASTPPATTMASAAPRAPGCPAARCPW